MKLSYRGFTHSAAVKNIPAAPAAAILAKRLPNKSDATNRRQGFHVMWVMKK
jgi:hypothetical protein